MPRQSVDFLITDSHAFHDRVVEFCGRPENHWELLVANCKRLVAPQDRLFHLGDVIFYKHETLKPTLDSIPGKKILLMGNHDHKSQGWYSRNGFDFVCEMLVIDGTKDSPGGILLSHKPQEILPQGVRINIHGHHHNAKYREYPIWYADSTHRNLSIEETKYMPVKLREFAR